MGKSVPLLLACAAAALLAAPASAGTVCSGQGDAAAPAAVQEGENIAYAGGSYATPRTIFRLWMNSSGHRRNILGPYREVGIGLRVGTLGDVAGAHVWTQELGSRDC